MVSRPPVRDKRDVPPAELNDVLGQFYDEALRDGEAERQIRSAVMHLTPEGRQTVKRFLDRALDDPKNAGRLKRIWWKSPTDVAPADPGSAVALFTMIRDAIADMAAERR